MTGCIRDHVIDDEENLWPDLPYEREAMLDAYYEDDSVEDHLTQIDDAS